MHKSLNKYLIFDQNKFVYYAYVNYSFFAMPEGVALQITEPVFQLLMT